MMNETRKAGRLVACSGTYEQHVRPGRDAAEDLIREMAEDMEGHADAEDVALWSDADGEPCRLLAVIRPGPDGMPLVTRFGAGPDPSAPASAPARLKKLRRLSRLVRRMDAAHRRWDRAMAEAERLDRVHPGPRQAGGTEENYFLVRRFERSKLDPACTAANAAERRLCGEISATGHLAAIVCGRLFLAMTTDELQEDLCRGIPMARVLVLDGESLRSSATPDARATR